jgi:hypothetical protein
MQVQDVGRIPFQGGSYLEKPSGIRITPEPERFSRKLLPPGPFAQEALGIAPNGDIPSLLAETSGQKERGQFSATDAGGRKDLDNLEFFQGRQRTPLGIRIGSGEDRSLAFYGRLKKEESINNPEGPERW